MGLKQTVRRFTVVMLILGLPFCLVSQAAAQSTQDLQQEIQELKKQMEQLNNKLQETEKKFEQAQEEQEWNTEDIEVLSERVTETEKHSAADKVELGVSLEPRVWSVHLQDMQSAFPVLQSAFPAMEAFQENTGMGFTAPQIQGLLGGQFTTQQIQGLFGQAGVTIDPQTAQQLADLENPPTLDVDNDAVRTLKFRLRMDSKFNEHLRFAGRLAAYKVFGDSVGININKGGFQDISFDGTTASNPHGDTIRLERAYFVYQDEWGAVPWSFSLGRRPSTEGPPLDLQKNLPAVGGSPHAHLINWQFDGGSLNFNLEEAVGIPGFDIKFCYGSGFENQYGTASAFVAEPETDDVDFYGVIGTLYENYLPDWDTELSIGYNYAFAPNITDGFTGLTVFPFNVTKENDQYFFSGNDLGAVSRFEASTKIGDWHALSLLTQANMLEGNLDLFLSGAWSYTDAEKVSEIPLFEMLGSSLLSSNGDLDSHNGWSVYTGGRYTLPEWSTRIGLEYNYGSKYWFNVTGAEDNLIGPKLATRGHVLEPYIIKEFFGKNFFARLGGQFYWFDYSGSGFPLGEPVNVNEVSGADSIFPVIDEMQIYYLSLVARF